ncbi:hypothetical protein [Agrobacterium pusense]|uniref:Uncharacterized protein n=1 Tax=Agrobacterium pusense TaxID=648995 RepID=A0A6H0ZT91_9HYPH|nr:hypothetical protein [Agrobacterium pusense]QIX24016.1 hypothetical protein FOB41_23135 [Agrobacterium pusense]
MIKRLTIAAFALIAATSATFANSILSDAASPITKITRGHGNPGDTATSVSDPNVNFRVLDSGKVERTNSRLGTTSIIDPSEEVRRNNRR